jgi:DNA-binding GntR family transcriptional regulator
MPEERITQADKIALELRKMILSKTLKPGQHIVQDEISKMFGISRIPVREALKILEAEGLIFSEPYKGSVVNDINLDYIEETYFLRSVLEGISCSQATLNYGTNELKELKEIMVKAEDAFASEDKIEFVHYSKEFHTHIHSLSGYKRLLFILENLRTGISPYTPNNLKEQGIRSIQDHRYIFERISKRDAQGAGNAMRMHIQRACIDIIESLKEEFSDGYQRTERINSSST